jgi:hypothetical protein
MLILDFRNDDLLLFNTTRSEAAFIKMRKLLRLESPKSVCTQIKGTYFICVFSLLASVTNIVAT